MVSFRVRVTLGLHSAYIKVRVMFRLKARVWVIRVRVHVKRA